MNECDIQDHRTLQDFKGITFSKYQKSKVKSELIKCLRGCHVEAALNWTAELVCAAHFADVWEVVVLLVSKYIHLGNPKLPIYIVNRFTSFKNIASQDEMINELDLRNHPTIRQLFAEVMAVLCFSRKKHSMEQIKIKKSDEFNMTHMASRLQAPNVSYCAPVFKPHDPAELFIALNEFAYHISIESKNVVMSCYWLEWILEYVQMCYGKKQFFYAEPRDYPKVSDKYKRDVIWIVWDALFHCCKLKNDALLHKVMNALVDVYSIKYSNSARSRRRYVLYFAISLLTEPVDLTTKMISNQKEIDFMVAKVDVIYKTIKKNEMQDPEIDDISIPVTSSISKKNSNKSLDASLKRLQIVNTNDKGLET